MRATIPSRELLGSKRKVESIAVTVDESSRFASELRRWRDSRRLSPLELAIRAGTTQRHVSFLEQARSRPGRPVVIRLAEALDLSLRQRNELLLAAGFAPAFRESALDSSSLQPVREAIESILIGHLPFPAVVVRPYGGIVAANAAIELATTGASPALLEPPVNVLRLSLHPEGMAPRVENLAEWGRHITESLRAHAFHDPDPRLDAFIEELESYVPPFHAGPDHLGFAVPLRLRCDEGELRLITTLTSFATAVDVTLARCSSRRSCPPTSGVLITCVGPRTRDAIRYGCSGSPRRDTKLPERWVAQGSR